MSVHFRCHKPPKGVRKNKKGHEKGDEEIEKEGRRIKANK
jgi:hypothetical protein